MQRETWSSGAGFVLAAVGSAVGLGNMWRFSATAASTGGAGFVAVYVFMVLLIGLPLLLGELILGRRFQSSPVAALTRAVGRPGAALGWFFVLTAFVILAFYSVIAGWTFRYGLESIAGGWEGDLTEHFLAIATGPAAVLYHLLFMALTMMVVLWGIKGGIEKFASLATPVLFLILVGLGIWAAFLRGASEGYAFYLAPDLSVLADPAVWGAAAGQTYFSMSIGMGALLTYASYLRSSDKLATEAAVISVSDFAVAFMAGLVIFPIVFSLGMGDTIAAFGADEAEGVLFIALPAAFEQLGGTGYFVGVVFFLALILAALTSTISLMEVIVSTLIDSLSVSRRRATIGVGVCAGLIGVLPGMSLPALSMMNRFAGEFFLGFGAFAITLLVGWFMDDPRRELRAALGDRALMVNGWYFVMRWIAPLITGFVVVNMLQQYFAG